VTTDECQLPVRLAPENIEIFIKILEGYDNLCLVTAIEPSKGEMLVRPTADTRADVLKILRHMPFPVEVIEKTAE